MTRTKNTKSPHTPLFLRGEKNKGKGWIPDKALMLKETGLEQY
jgi:hypothetical protein